MPYSPIEFKGKGGFARVDVVHNELGQQFAQKTYDPAPELLRNVGDDHLKRRFVREVNYQSNISHPNVVQIIEHFLHEDPPFFIMPLAECTLKEELETNPQLDGSLNSALFDILAGLEHLHQSGFTHRDLKPANVLKFNENGNARYAISDFGLMSATNSESSTLTGTNAGGGTENYAAPEMIGSFRRATASADIYAFGAILHDIFGSGHHRIPYTELTLPGAIGQIIEKCTKRLPIRRYRNVSILRDELYQVLHTESITFNSSNEERAVQLLKSKNDLTADEWDCIFIQIDQNLAQSVSCGNIMSALSLEHIDHLLDHSPDLFSAMADYYTDYIIGGSFDFDYCDILASKAGHFYENADIGMQAKIAVALLYLGTSHNRWYVERKVVHMMGTNISEALANRIAIEVKVSDVRFDGQIAHLCKSLGVDRNFLHPILLEFLGES